MARHVKGNAVSVSVEHVRVVEPLEPDRTRGWFNSQHSIEADMDAADVLKQLDKGQPIPDAAREEAEQFLAPGRDAAAEGIESGSGRKLPTTAGRFFCTTTARELKRS
jgi:hypothetical protein